MGLLITGRQVELVTDAIQHLDERKAKKMKEEFTAAGGKLVSSQEILAA
jgi:hypothetical protein